MNSSENIIEQLDEAKAFLVKACGGSLPSIAITLGSGLNDLLTEMKTEVEIPYADIPNMKAAAVQGHRGRLVVGKLNHVRVACMQGRLHFFEGHSMMEVVFLARALAWSGVKAFIMTNATGGLHPYMVPGELVLVRDHINFMGTNSLIGKNEEKLGPRFPDMTYLYDPKISEMFSQVATKHGISLRKGIYVALHGPSYETPAEIRMYRMLGGDIVGMSTIPEAIAVHHMGKKVAAISCVTNLAAGVLDQPLVHDEVLENAKKAQAGFSRLISEALPLIQGSV